MFTTKFSYLHQLFPPEPILQCMLDQLNAREELDVPFQYGVNGGKFLENFRCGTRFCYTYADTTVLNEILNLLVPTSHKFNELGKALNLEGNVMEEILYKVRHSSTFEALIQVLTKWLKWNYSYQTLGKPSLSWLVKDTDKCNPPLSVSVFQTFTSAVGEHC